MVTSVFSENLSKPIISSITTADRTLWSFGVILFFSWIPVLRSHRNGIALICSRETKGVYNSLIYVMNEIKGSTDLIPLSGPWLSILYKLKKPSLKFWYGCIPLYKLLHWNQDFLAERFLLSDNAMADSSTTVAGLVAGLWKTMQILSRNHNLKRYACKRKNIKLYSVGQGHLILQKNGIHAVNKGNTKEASLKPMKWTKCIVSL